MNIYFDMNIYNRIFDDQSQLRIRFESMAIDILFELCDDKFIKTIKKNKNDLKDIMGKIKIYNPIDFLRKEMDIDVIE